MHHARYLALLENSLYVCVFVLQGFKDLLVSSFNTEDASLYWWIMLLGILLIVFSIGGGVGQWMYARSPFLLIHADFTYFSTSAHVHV